MATSDEIISIVENALNLSGYQLKSDSALLGSIPEFDSQAVLTVITAIEEHFDVFFEDDEITAEIFESIHTLSLFVEEKL